MDAYNNVGIDSIETAKNLKKLRIENNLKLKQVRRDWTFGRADGMQLGEQNTSETSKH